MTQTGPNPGSALRILYTHRTQGVGAEGAHIMGMVEGFQDLGHSVEMDCLPGCDPFEHNGVPLHHGSPPSAVGSRLKVVYRLIADHAPQFVFGMVEFLYNIPLFWRLWNKQRRLRPDLLYERYALGNFAPALVCRVFRIPLVVEVNDSVAVERSRPLSFPRVKRMLEWRILSSSALVLTVSQRFKVQLLDAFPDLPESKILVCPNAVSRRRFRIPTPESTEALRVRLGLGRRTLLGSAGQFSRWHDLPALVTAMAAEARERDLGFLFIGDGPVKGEVLEAARASGVEDRTVFTGMVPLAQIPELLALLDVAVISSSNLHGSPMKLMEFMAMNRPVVAPDLSPIREVVEDGHTGRLFRFGDMDDMRRLVVELLEDREAAQEMGRRAREFVLTHLTWTEHARTVLETLGREKILSTIGESH